jgi:hypothetical protein
VRADIVGAQEWIDPIPRRGERIELLLPRLGIRPRGTVFYAAAVPPGQIIRKARNAASHPTSHKQHGNTRLATAPDRPTRRVSQSLEGCRLRTMTTAR